MSLGPTLPKDADIKPKAFEKMKISGKKAFQKPAHYIFYTGLAALMGCLLCGVAIPWQYYAILGFLGLVKIYQNIIKTDVATK